MTSPSCMAQRRICSDKRRGWKNGGSRRRWQRYAVCVPVCVQAVALLYTQRKRKADVAPAVDLPPPETSATLPATQPDSEPAKSKPKHGAGHNKLVGQPKLSSKAAASQLPPPSAKQSSSSLLNTASVVSHVALKATGELKYKTVAEDPSAREAYKSLFVSGAKEEPKNKAHWVTYFPYH